MQIHKVLSHILKGYDSLMLTSWLTIQNSCDKIQFYIVLRMRRFVISPHTHPHRIIFKLFHKAACSGKD